MNKSEQSTRREQWRAIVEKQEESGLSQAEYCKQHNLVPVKLSILTTIMLISTTGITQTLPSACPSLISLGISQLVEKNVELPMWEPGTPDCISVPKGETCYVTWNLGERARKIGYMFSIETAGINPETALAVINNSDIFNIIPSGDPDPAGSGCEIISGNIHLWMWALSSNNNLFKAINKFSR